MIFLKMNFQNVTDMAQQTTYLITYQTTTGEIFSTKQICNDIVYAAKFANTIAGVKSILSIVTYFPTTQITFK